MRMYINIRYTYYYYPLKKYSFYFVDIFVLKDIERERERVCVYNK